MASKCYYCQTEGDFETFQNPETGKFRPTCGRCKAQLITYQRKAQFIAQARFFGIPLLTLAAILWLLFGNWQASVLSSITAGLIAMIDPAMV